MASKLFIKKKEKMIKYKVEYNNKNNKIIK